MTIHSKSGSTKEESLSTNEHRSPLADSDGSDRFIVERGGRIVTTGTSFDLELSQIVASLDGSLEVFSDGSTRVELDSRLIRANTVVVELDASAPRYGIPNLESYFDRGDSTNVESSPAIDSRIAVGLEIRSLLEEFVSKLRVINPICLLVFSIRRESSCADNLDLSTLLERNYSATALRSAVGFLSLGQPHIVYFPISEFGERGASSVSVEGRESSPSDFSIGLLRSRILDACCCVHVVDREESNSSVLARNAKEADVPVDAGIARRGSTSIDPDSRSTIEMHDSRALFVCGSPRSGTTILAQLLGAHPEVVLGVERYKLRYSSGKIEPILFTRDRFFEFDETDTNATGAQRRALTASLWSKFPSAKYVGDKYPRIYRSIPQLRGIFPSAKFIYIVRNPIEVAMSWDARARNEKDNWPAANDFRRAVPEWNYANRVVLSSIRSGADVLVINYHRLFSERHGLNEVSRVCSFLDLSVERGFLDVFGAALADAVQLSRRRKVPPDEIVKFVEGEMDAMTCRKLVLASRCGFFGLPSALRPAADDD